MMPNKWISLIAFIFIIYAVYVGNKESSQHPPASAISNEETSITKKPTAEEKILAQLNPRNVEETTHSDSTSQMPKNPLTNNPEDYTDDDSEKTDEIIPTLDKESHQTAQKNNTNTTLEGHQHNQQNIPPSVTPTQTPHEKAETSTSSITLPTERAIVKIDENMVQNFEGSYLEKKAVNILTLLAKSPEGRQLLENLFSNPGQSSPCAAKQTPITTFDGIKFIDLDLGIGRSAICGDNVKIAYAVRNANDQLLTEGSEEIHLGQLKLLKGLEQAVVGMQEGGKRKVYIPSHLAFDPPEFRHEAIPIGEPVYAEITLQKLIPTISQRIPRQFDTKPGNGIPIMCGDIVPIHYKISRLDGSILYNSHDRRREPLALKVGNLETPTGFQLAVEKMHFGGKRTLILTPTMLRAGSEEMTRRFIPSGVELKDQAYILDVEVLHFHH